MSIDLQSLKGRYAGRPAVILGDGPSLREWTPAEALDMGAVVFCVNQAVRKFPSADWWTFYDHEMTDALVVGEWPLPRKLLHPSVAWKMKHEGFYEVGFEDVREGRGRTFMTFRGAPTLTRESNGVWPGHSSALAPIQFAWVAGCSLIHLRGIDLRADEEGRLHWYENDGGTCRLPLEVYSRMEPQFRRVLRAVEGGGVPVTVSRLSVLADEFKTEGGR